MSVRSAQSPMGDMELMTVDQVAKELHCHRTYVLRLIRSKELPGLRLGRKWLIPSFRVKEYIRKLLGGSPN